jgi:hypothetical protein
MVVSWTGRALIVVALVTFGACAGGSGEETDAPALIGGGNELLIAFPVMYSAFDGVHSFKIPAIVQNVKADKWSAEPADAVDLADDGAGGVMITTRQAGDFKIIAHAGPLRGEAELHVTEASPEQWVAGEMRYKNNVRIELPMAMPMEDGGMGGMGMRGPMIEFPDNASCGNCHGAGGERLNVEHTPQQIGGYSDQELITIFTTGTKPMGSPFKSQIPAFAYRMFHTWSTASPEEAQALVVYLRGLEPKSQEEINFRRPGSGTQQ